ncbi:MAG TPA: VWA domain-containing protein [Candidatus Polarisedimenticolaceae bacterium]|nr:VWA domain-containing protein [Candidatus Polarisedimenticolaceae bacterium]
MLDALARFVASLRVAGVRASPGEVLDAARALEAVGIEDRARVRAALAAALVKTHTQRAAFERAFDAFFAPPARGGEGKKEKAGGGAGGARPTARGRAEQPRDRRPSPHPSTRPERKADQAREAAVRERLQAARERDRKRAGRLRQAPGQMRRKQGPATEARRFDLTRRTSTEEERALAHEVPRLIEEIRRKPSRRLRRAAHGRIHVRAVFRENLSRGGVPFVLPLRRPRLRRPRVVLLVDVSWSAARATAYFLWMAAAFLRLGRRTRVLLFVDRPVDATAEVARWASRAARDRSAERSFTELLKRLPGLNPQAPSDYGRALHALLSGPSRPKGRDTLLLVLGDARTNRYPPLPFALEELRRGCQAVLWLVPEPEVRWGTADSALPEYLPHLDVVVPATDLEGLAEGLRALLRRL